MPAPPQIRPSRDKDAAAVLVEFLKPGAWIPPAHVGWLPVIEALLEAFLRHFDGAVLAQLLDHQRALPPSAAAAARAARMAGELTALHKICQMLARNLRLSAEARAHSRPWKASRRKQFRIRPSRRRSLLPCRRGQIWSWTRRIRKLVAAAWADVFRFRDRTSEGHAINSAISNQLNRATARNPAFGSVSHGRSCPWLLDYRRSVGPHNVSCCSHTDCRSCVVLGCIRDSPGQRNVDRTYSNSAILHKMKGFYWILILLMLSVGKIESVQAAPASPSGAAPLFPKPVEDYHDEQIPGIRAKLVQRIQAEPFNLVGTLIFLGARHSLLPNSC